MAALRLRTPPGLWDAVPLHGVAAGLRVVMDLSGGTGTRVTIKDVGMEGALFEVGW